MPATVRQEREPASTRVTEVAEGVLRMQLPISMPGLGHVNCYALLDDRGVTLVDPGLPGRATFEAIRQRLRSVDIPLERVHTVVVTHSHPDHFGGAGAVCSATGADLITHQRFRTWFSPAEDDTTDDTGDGDERPARPSHPWGGPTPWGGPAPRPPLKRRLQYMLMRRLAGRRFATPAPSRRVTDAERVRLGGRDFVALHTPGHTTDHLCLWDPDGGLLLSGDHVLPTITPHISGMGATSDPLADFLASLDKVEALGDVGLVLPAHGHPFRDLPGRVDAIRRHHFERLDRFMAALQRLGEATIPELAAEVFPARSRGPMADSETFAHMEHLRLAGRVRRREDAGVLRYRPAA